jgi:uncharacterized protein
MASLQDQLLKAGVVNKQKLNKVKKEKHKAVKQQPKGKPVVDEAKELARKAREEKAARDREINRQNQLAAQQKALQAQIVQLIAMNKIDRSRGEVAYQFTDAKKIKKIYVTDVLHRQLGAGVIAIARLNEHYELIPSAVADKIRERDKSAIVLHNTRSTEQVDEDDPYADFQVPDDLMW